MKRGPRSHRRSSIRINGFEKLALSFSSPHDRCPSLSSLCTPRMEKTGASLPPLSLAAVTCAHHQPATAAAAAAVVSAAAVAASVVAVSGAAANHWENPSMEATLPLVLLAAVM